MNVEIIIAIITALGAIGGSLIGYLTASKVTDYRLNELEKNVDSMSTKLNDIYNLNTMNAVQNEKIAVNTSDITAIFKRLDALEAK